jgi:hypothetical protein
MVRHGVSDGGREFGPLGNERLRERTSHHLQEAIKSGRLSAEPGM